MILNSVFLDVAVIRHDYGKPNGAKFKNSNLITFKDNDHIRIQDMKINQIQQASRSYSRSYITFNMNIPDIHIQHIEN